MGESSALAFGLLFGLGVFHGVNPGMGWLFAVALGLQERRRAAVWLALAPLAAGHGLAILCAVAVAATMQVAVSPASVGAIAGASLIALGASRLIRHRHPRFGGMRVGFAGLTMWSFVMATAHGAGLMALPLMIGAAAGDAAQASDHAHHMAAHGSPTAGLLAGLLGTLAHGGGYLLATAALAVLVYEKLGVGVLRRAWINIDLIWAAALIATGAVTWLW